MWKTRADLARLNLSEMFFRAETDAFSADWPALCRRPARGLGCSSCLAVESGTEKERTTVYIVSIVAPGKHRRLALGIPARRGWALFYLRSGEVIAVYRIVRSLERNLIFARAVSPMIVSCCEEETIESAKFHNFSAIPCLRFVPRHHLCPKTLFPARNVQSHKRKKYAREYRQKWWPKKGGSRIYYCKFIYRSIRPSHPPVATFSNLGNIDVVSCKCENNRLQEGRAAGCSFASCGRIKRI